MLFKNDTRFECIRLLLRLLLLILPLLFDPPLVYLYPTFTRVKAYCIRVLQYDKLFLELWYRLCRGYGWVLNYLPTTFRRALICFTANITSLWTRKWTERTRALKDILLTGILILIPIKVNSFAVNNLKTTFTIIFWIEKCDFHVMWEYEHASQHMVVVVIPNIFVCKLKR